MLFRSRRVRSGTTGNSMDEETRSPLQGRTARLAGMVLLFVLPTIVLMLYEVLS